MKTCSMKKKNGDNTNENRWFQIAIRKLCIGKYLRFVEFGRTTKNKQLTWKIKWKIVRNAFDGVLVSSDGKQSKLEFQLLQ